MYSTIEITFSLIQQVVNMSTVLINAGIKSLSHITSNLTDSSGRNIQDRFLNAFSSSNKGVCFFVYIFI